MVNIKPKAATNSDIFLKKLMKQNLAYEYNRKTFAIFILVVKKFQTIPDAKFELY